MSFPAQVYRARVREVNGHRLTFAEARDEPKAVVWRVLVAARRRGHWEFLFDDYVLEANLTLYLLVAQDRGAERITIHRKGSVEEVLEEPKPRPKATSLRSERGMSHLEDFMHGGKR